MIGARVVLSVFFVFECAVVDDDALAGMQLDVVVNIGVVNDAGRGVDVIIDDVDHRVSLIRGLLPAIEGLHAVADGSGDDLHAVADPP